MPQAPHPLNTSPGAGTSRSIPATRFLHGPTADSQFGAIVQVGFDWPEAVRPALLASLQFANRDTPLSAQSRTVAQALFDFVVDLALPATVCVKGLGMPPRVLRLASVRLMQLFGLDDVVLALHGWPLDRLGRPRLTRGGTTACPAQMQMSRLTETEGWTPVNGALPSAALAAALNQQLARLLTRQDEQARQ